MRLVLRFSMLLVIAGLAWSQALTDAAAAVAGGSVGAGAGKKVGEGISNVLNKVDATTAKAAKTEKSASAEKPGDKTGTTAKPSQKASAGDGASGGSGGGAVLKVGPGGVVKDHSLVPPPPAKKVVAVVPPPPPLTPPAPAVQIPVLVLPPPPQATPEDLRTLAGGTPRADVLKLGPPSSRITMFDDGHLVEIYRYQSRDTTFGVVRLSDGSVSNVQVR
ncbi:MAG: hypothetical protein LAP61_08485 [Acidobacteriia bacterium]|nr:hypothetical protein [Terriglobia bacterium]